MKSDDANAVADFLKQGGEILKVQGAISVTEGELLLYLESCGVKVKFFPADMKPYACLGRRHTALALVRLANTYRRDQQLPPVML